MVDVSTVVTTAGVTAGMQFLVWVFFRRAVVRNDKTIEELRKKVDGAQEDRLLSLQKAVDHATASRSGIHSRIDEVKIGYRKTEDCAAHLKAMACSQKELIEATKKLERIDQKLETYTDRVEAVGAQQYAMQRELSELKGSHQ